MRGFFFGFDQVERQWLTVSHDSLLLYLSERVIVFMDGTFGGGASQKVNIAY